MAVLIEGYSVVIHKALAQAHQDALAALAATEGSLHPMAVCSDEALLRVSFLDLQQAQAFISELENAGLKHRRVENGAEMAKEVALVTQFGEIEIPCAWLSVQFTKLKDNTLIAVASLKDDQPIKGVAFPKGWSLDTSILKRFYDERTHYMQENYRWLRSEPMHDIYQHPESKQEVRLLKLQFTETPKTQLQ
jgi:hypothetical protein